MDVKFGKVKPNGSNIFLTATSSRSDTNFFASNPEKSADTNKKEISTQSGRINDYDSTILENNAYQEISNEMFKVEHKIELLEQSLLKINSEIDALQSLGYAIQISNLEERKQKIEQELAELNKKYSELGFSAKISGQIASVVNFTSNKKTSTFSKIKKFVSKKILAKISKKFNYSQNMKEALDKLSNINSSVDELINMKIPYGETINRYDRLTAYLNKANVIHSQISRNMGSIAKKKS